MAQSDKLNKRYLLCSVAGFPLNTSRKFTHLTLGEIVVFHTASGFYALENRCPHAGAPLNDAIIDRDHITCIWHGWEIELSTGRCSNANQMACTYPVVVENGTLFLIANKNDSEELA